MTALTAELCKSDERRAMGVACGAHAQSSLRTGN